jgi:hypothetical protein
MKLVKDAKTVKVRLDGLNKAGANATRQFHVADTNIDELVEFLKNAVSKEQQNG